MKKFLICVDSDGCAMDTMDIKHIRCFGPCLVEEWELDGWADAILARWNEINLYTMTRGINRFKGLAFMLREVNDKYTAVEGIQALENWVSISDELSEKALKKTIADKSSICLEKALAWSVKVNECISRLKDDEKRPFEGVKEGLAFAHQYADIAIVSSANYQAVEEEWALYGLLDHVDVIMAQDTGSKAFCISELLKKGYSRDKVLMTGDAPGDYEAARANGVFFYPILVRREKESWTEFREKAVEKLLDKSYAGAYQAEKLRAFQYNLK